MELTQALQEVGVHTYDRLSPLGLKQPIFSSLTDFKSAIQDRLPAGYTVKISQGVGALPIGLWVAILNDEVTQSPTEGLYIVYLFDQDRLKVSLSLNQGVTKAAERARTLPISGNDLLRAEALHLRGLLQPDPALHLETHIALGSGTLLRSYEAGNVLAKTWDLKDLPDENELLQTLDLFLDMYDSAVAAKEDALKKASGSFATPARGGTKNSKREPVFAPKSSDDYIIAARTYIEPQRRQRRHEQLVRDFGEFEKGRGFVPATNHHPIDLVLLSNDFEILVEIKILDAQHPASGVRESIGQLFEYRKFLRPENSETPLLAVYDAFPNEAFAELLDELGIIVCWKTPNGFSGTEKAIIMGLVAG